MYKEYLINFKTIQKLNNIVSLILNLKQNIKII